MNVHTLSSIQNSVLVVCTASTILGLYYMGAGGFSAIGLVLLFGLASSHSDGEDSKHGI